jgi:hypothetical protein
MMHTQTAEKLKVFVDAADFLERPLKTPFLYPLSGMPDWSKFVEGPIKKGVFDGYVQGGKSFLHLTELGNCDYIVFPYDYQYSFSDPFVAARLGVYAQYEQDSGKPVLLFYPSDPEVNRFLKDVPFKNPIVFANSIFRSSQPAYLHNQPTFINDPLADYGHSLSVRAKGEKAIIGFCGFAAPLGIPWSKYRVQEEVRLLLYRLNLLNVLKIDGFHAPRVLALQKLVSSRLVSPNFILREHSAFHASKGLMAENVEQEYVENFRRQYFDNIVGSDYTLCARGNGNFSFRLYETLALGRIPIFIDTDCALPLENQIDWQRYCVWVDEKQIGRIDKIVKEFHDRLNKQQFEQLQKDCRQLWEEYLRPEGFFSRLVGELSNHSTVRHSQQV